MLTLLFVLNFIPVWAQHQGVLTGKVLLEDKSAADFATVYLKGTSYGCMTDERGGFCLEAPAGAYTLVVSAVGFETAEHKLQFRRVRIQGKRLFSNLLLRSWMK